LSALALVLALQMALGLMMVMGQPNASLWMIFIWSLTEVISNIINVFIYSIFATVILSWISPSAHNPVVELLYKITEPVLKPCQRLIPPMGGFDLSPMVALLGLQVLKMLVLPPLFALM
jgi:YggT family protein